MSEFDTKIPIIKKPRLIFISTDRFLQRHIPQCITGINSGHGRHGMLWLNS